MVGKQWILGLRNARSKAWGATVILRRARVKALHANVQTSQPIPTHIVLLIAIAKIQGDGEEYRRAGLLTTVVTSRATE
jgi:hypothetical protein